jgi:perosamine synthetase
MADVRIPWARPFLGREEVTAVTALLEDRRLSMGREVAQFEAEMAALAGRRHALALANGSVALDVALRLAGVGAGDDVLVSAFSYIATTNSIFWQGSRPVFCDIDPVTLNVDLADAQARLTPATTAFLVADYCGSPPDYDAIEAFCADAGVALIVDGAQAVGGSFAGRSSLARGLVSTTSLHTAKAFLTGEGGMVFLDDDALLERGRRLRGQGEIPGRKYIHDTLAYNYRLTELAAAIGRAQIARADQVLGRRAELVARYRERLAGVDGVTFAGHHARSTPSWFSFAILIPDRDAVAAGLREAGIETRSLYPIPSYRQPIPEYAPYAGLDLPNTEHAAAHVLNPPLFYEMTDAEVDDVCDAIAAALDDARTLDRSI